MDQNGSEWSRGPRGRGVLSVKEYIFTNGPTSNAGCWSFLSTNLQVFAAAEMLG